VTEECWYIGIDIGGTWLRLVAAGPEGRAHAGPVLAPATYSALLESVEPMVPAEAKGKIVRASCGVPGSCSDGRPSFVPALSFMEGKPLAADLSSALGAPVNVGTDGHFTLFAEVREGAARGARSSALVAVGTGVGGAIMVEGRIWRGHRASAGSWGWLPACPPRNERSPEDAEGGAVHGRFETVASGSALSELAQATKPGWSGPQLVQAARAGDALALRTLGAYARKLASGVAAIASTFDPELVLIGGGLSAAMDVLGPLLRHHVEALASPAGRRVPVRAAALGPAGGAIGALLDAKEPGAL
jgi:predicted NBD/HSP70 family sugar kinase